MARTWLWTRSSRLRSFCRREPVRYVVAWIAAFAGVAICAISGWTVMRDARRRDGNSGHVSVDFSGQWLLGRLLVSGQGQVLYERSHERAVLREAYPRADEAPDQEKSDADAIMDALMGSDEAADPGGNGPTPRNVGGPLYPPIDAFVYAPLGLLSPRIAYRLAQLGAVVFLFVAAGAIGLLARGRIWWPVAAVLLMMLPGVGGSISLGQNAPLSLAILSWGWLLVARGRPGWGGGVWGLLAYKPVWAVAFFLVPVLTRRWRMALAMLASGTILAALTLPFVGWQSWIDWLHVGREATQTYDVDQNWIEMSRDLLSIPRRWLINFSLPYEERSRNWLAPTLLGWAVLLAILEATVRLACLHGERPAPVVGPGAAFLLLSAWLTCFHFMYYDVLLAGLPVFLLFTEPRRFLEPIHVGSAQSRKKGNVCLLNRMAPTIFVLLVVTQPFWFLYAWHAPPGETLLLAVLWIWSGRSWLREKRPVAS